MKIISDAKWDKKQLNANFINLEADDTGPGHHKAAPDGVVAGFTTTQALTLLQCTKGCRGIFFVHVQIGNCAGESHKLYFYQNTKLEKYS